MAQKKVVYIAKKYLAHKGEVIAIGKEVSGLSAEQFKTLFEKGFVKKADAKEEVKEDTKESE